MSSVDKVTSAIPPIMDAIMLSMIRMGTISMSTFLAFQNSGILPRLRPSVPSRLVAMAVCGGNPKKMSAGILISDPLPVSAPRKPLTSPITIISITHFCILQNIYLFR